MARKIPDACSPVTLLIALPGTLTPAPATGFWHVLVSRPYLDKEFARSRESRAKKRLRDGLIPGLRLGLLNVLGEILLRSIMRFRIAGFRVRYHSVCCGLWIKVCVGDRCLLSFVFATGPELCTQDGNRSMHDWGRLVYLRRGCFVSVHHPGVRLQVRGAGVVVPVRAVDIMRLSLQLCHPAHVRIFFHVLRVLGDC